MTDCCEVECSVLTTINEDVMLLSVITACSITAAVDTTVVATIVAIIMRTVYTHCYRDASVELAAAVAHH